MKRLDADQIAKCDQAFSFANDSLDKALREMRNLLDGEYKHIPNAESWAMSVAYYMSQGVESFHLQVLVAALYRLSAMDENAVLDELDFDA